MRWEGRAASSSSSSKVELVEGQHRRAQQRRGSGEDERGDLLDSLSQFCSEREERWGERCLVWWGCRSCGRAQAVVFSVPGEGSVERKEMAVVAIRFIVDQSDHVLLWSLSLVLLSAGTAGDDWELNVSMWTLFLGDFDS
jgi:hypothetical protein